MNKLERALKWQKGIQTVTCPSCHGKICVQVSEVLLDSCGFKYREYRSLPLTWGDHRARNCASYSGWLWFTGTVQTAFSTDSEQ